MKTIIKMMIAMLLGLLLVIKIQPTTDQLTVVIFTTASILIYCIINGICGKEANSNRTLNHMESMMRRQHACNY